MKKSGYVGEGRGSPQGFFFPGPSFFSALPPGLPEADSEREKVTDSFFTPFCELFFSSAEAGEKI